MSDPIELKVKPECFVIDPVDFEPAEVERTVVAKPTEGPHRYTLYVPHDDKARISVGQAHPILGETGIAMETLSHIHLWTYGESVSYLHLGDAPTMTGTDVNQSTQGYSLYTNGWSKHVGEKQIMMASQTDGIALIGHCDVQLHSQIDNVGITAGNSILAHADGDIELDAGTDEPFEYSWKGVLGGVVLAALDGADFLAPHVSKDSKLVKTQKLAKNCNKTEGYFDKDYKSDSKKTYEHWISMYGETTTKWLDHGKTLISLGLSLKKTWKTAKEAKTGWEKTTSWWELGHHMMEWWAEITSLHTDIAELAAPKPKSDCAGGKGSGQIKMKAKKSVSIAADKSVTIYGANGVSMSGFKSATVSSTLGTTISALKTTTVFGGLGVKVQSLAGDAGVTSDLGQASIKAKKKVQIASEEEGVYATGKKDVQLNSTDAKLYGHGAQGAYVGAGEGDGFGLIVKPKQLELGSVSSAEDFKGVKADSSRALIMMSPSGILMKKGDSHKIYMTASSLKIDTPKLEIKASSQVKMDGSVIHIG